MRFAILAATAALGFTAPAEAATIVQSGSLSTSGGTGQIAKFNPAAGTLQQILFSISGLLNDRVAFSGTSEGGPVSFQSTWGGIFGLYVSSDGASGTIGEIANFAPGLVGPFAPSSYYETAGTAAGGASGSIDPLALLIGPGFASIYVVTSQSAAMNYTQLTGAPHGIFQIQGRGDNATMNYSVTYVYDESAPAVPEPATWAMVLAGFGVVGGAMRRAPNLRFRLRSR